ncbi:MAG TPA: AI-2E family transporter [Microbacteriaceae bacterium]|jgi:predicted PurR-regulated permease PerM|nr:AI-2E family transporter [Microbacteriaceae bacterium]
MTDRGGKKTESGARRWSFLARLSRSQPSTELTGTELTSEQPTIEESLPRGIQLAGAWSWRLLVIGAVLAVVIFLIIQLRLIVIPVLIAILVSALLVPLVNFLHRHRWPRWLAITLAMVGTIVVVAALVFFAVQQIRGEFPDLKKQGVASYESLRHWLSGPPFSLSDSQLNGYLAQIGKAIQEDSQALISGAVSIGSTLGHVLTGILLALFSTLFILIDGKGIWAWVVRVFPRRARRAIDGAGKTGWVTLGNFVRVQILVATIDAVGIGLGAFFLGLPLVVPIAVLVFLGSFIPVVGAVLTGVLAVVVALVYHGWLAALIMLAVVLLVQQIEGHVLQPLIMGSAVKVHPLAVVLAVAAGSFLAGIPGALFAVPFAAVLNVMVHYIAGGAWRAAPATDAVEADTPMWRTVPTERGGPGQ